MLSFASSRAAALLRTPAHIGNALRQSVASNGIGLTAGVSAPSSLAEPTANQARCPCGGGLINKRSLLTQHYNRLPIRKKWRTALKKGTFFWCSRTGQIKMPPLKIAGYDEKNPYRGRFEDLRATRVEFKY
mmetsp:Transcript_9009/g.20033  ORF Transcript_9009/g.20033 Transcript_9009/m.20033 type:complete len:131 (+) Transcript_9009:42-434(+)